MVKLNEYIKNKKANENVICDSTSDSLPLYSINPSRTRNKLNKSRKLCQNIIFRILRPK